MSGGVLVNPQDSTLLRVIGLGTGDMGFIQPSKMVLENFRRAFLPNGMKRSQE